MTTNEQDDVHHTKVLIVGAGPSGIACAFTLGVNGIPSIVIDRKERSKIGDKVCGDGYAPKFSQKAYEMVGLPRPEFMAYADTTVVRGMTDKSEMSTPNPSATIDRWEYGQYLLEETEKLEMVTILPKHSFWELLTEDKKIIGITARDHSGSNSTLIKIYADVVVDASGTGAIVRAKIPESMAYSIPRRNSNNDIAVAYREIIKTKESHQFQNQMYLSYEPELIEVGASYFWIFTKGTNMVNIGLGYRKTKENRGKNIRDMIAKIRDRYFLEYEVLRSQGDNLPVSLPIPSLVHNGFMAVGDAAALVNPLNGEGHGPAIFSGIYAAEQIIAARGEYTEQNLWGYNKKIWEKYGMMHVFGYSFIHFLDTFGSDTLNWLLESRIISEEDIVLYFEKTGSGFLATIKKLVKLIPKPKVMIGLLRMLRYNSKLQKHCKNYPSRENYIQWRNKLDIMLEKKY